MTKQLYQRHELIQPVKFMKNYKNLKMKPKELKKRCCAIIVVLLFTIPHLCCQIYEFKKIVNTIKNDDTTAFFKIINKGVSVDSRDKMNTTPLMIAVKLGKYDFSKILIRNKASINAVNDEGLSSLVFASSSGKMEMVKLLVEKGANINNSNSSNNYYTPLGIAIRDGHTDIYNYLMSKNPDLNRKVFLEGVDYLSLAIQNNNDSIAWDLIHRGIKLDLVSKERKGPIHYAIEYSNDSIFYYLLENNAGVNNKDINGFSPLDYSIVQKNYKAFKTLSKISVLNKRDIDGWSPLHLCIISKDTLIFDELLQMNIDINTYSFNDSISPIYLATLLNNNYFIDKLLQKNAEIKNPLRTLDSRYNIGFLHFKKMELLEKNNLINSQEKQLAQFHLTQALNISKENLADYRSKRVGKIVGTALLMGATSVALAYEYSMVPHSSYNNSVYAVKKYNLDMAMSEMTMDISERNYSYLISYYKSYREKCKDLLNKLNN